MIKVDKFPKTDSSQCNLTTFILTHAHSDHTVISRTFPCSIHCTSETKKILEDTLEKTLDGILCDNLKPNEWCVLNNRRLIFVFASGHCLGGIGFYYPTESRLHFGDGRPSRETCQLLKTALNEIPCDNTLSIDYDTFFPLEFPLVQPFLRVPKTSESKAIITDFLLRVCMKQNRDVHIRVAHFGALDALPISGFHYIWIGSNNSPGSRLSASAFHLWQNQNQKNLQNSKRQVVYLSRIFDKVCDVQKWVSNPVELLLSASWFCKEVDRWNTMFGICQMDRDRFRICVCSHASPRELCFLFTQFESTTRPPLVQSQGEEEPIA